MTRYLISVTVTLPNPLGAENDDLQTAVSDEVRSWLESLGWTVNSLAVTEGKATPNSGPAFPTPVTGEDPYRSGMTLRDWFAGQAVTTHAHPESIGDPATMAKHAYDVADALIAERARTSGR